MIVCVSRAHFLSARLCSKLSFRLGCVHENDSFFVLCFVVIRRDFEIWRLSVIKIVVYALMSGLIASHGGERFSLNQISCPGIDKFCESENM